mgnify:CR=1 FL=1
MKLIIDIGNSNTKIALFDEKNMFSLKILDDYCLKNILEFVSGHKVSSTIISTVKIINSEISSISTYFNAIILNSETPVPIKNKYKSTDTLGNDRLAAVTGANSLYPLNDIIVFDAGTCLTIDFINSKREYLGGRISPGIQVRYKSLNTFTDKLPLLSLENSTPFIGNDTYSSIISGVQQGIISEVSSVISDYRSKNQDIVALVTGGDCFFFEKELKKSIFAEPNLVLVGLNEILDFNE